MNSAPLRELMRDLAALIWPTACVACGAPDRDCCADCFARLRTLPEGKTLVVAGVPCFVRGTYAGPLRALLVAFKHEGRFGFRGVLGDALRSPLLDALALAAVSSRSEPPLLVAMPSRPSSVRKRGYRHLEVLIAKALPRGMPRPRVVRALRTTRGRVGQVGLSSSERERNAGRIAVSRRFRRSVRGRGIVLVDDIVTTGASVRRAILSLETAGGKVVAIAALSAAERRDSPGESANSIQTGRGGGIAAEGWSRVPGKA